MAGQAEKNLVTCARAILALKGLDIDPSGVITLPASNGDVLDIPVVFADGPAVE